MISNLDLAREYLRSVNAPFGLNQQLVVKGFARWLDERRSSVETAALLEDELTVWECGYCKAFNVERAARNCIYCLRDRPALKTTAVMGDPDAS